MVLEDVVLEKTPEAYFRWVASTPDGKVKTRGPTPATAVYRLHERLSGVVDGTATVGTKADSPGR